jgi:hypothetical protein
MQQMEIHISVKEIGSHGVMNADWENAINLCQLNMGCMHGGLKAFEALSTKTTINLCTIYLFYIIDDVIY